MSYLHGYLRFWIAAISTRMMKLVPSSYTVQLEDFSIPRSMCLSPQSITKAEGNASKSPAMASATGIGTTISQSHPKLIIEISQQFVCSKFDSNHPIRSQFCTCHDSFAVMACAKLWTDWMIIFHGRARYIFTKFQLWAHLAFVTWLLVTLNNGQLTGRPAASLRIMVLIIQTRC